MSLNSQKNTTINFRDVNFLVWNFPYCSMHEKLFDWLGFPEVRSRRQWMRQRSRQPPKRRQCRIKGPKKISGYINCIESFPKFCKLYAVKLPWNPRVFPWAPSETLLNVRCTMRLVYPRPIISASDPMRTSKYQCFNTDWSSKQKNAS